MYKKYKHRVSGRIVKAEIITHDKLLKQIWGKADFEKKYKKYDFKKKQKTAIIRSGRHDVWMLDENDFNDSYERVIWHKNLFNKIINLIK